MSPHSALWFSVEPVAKGQETDFFTRRTLQADEDWEQVVAGSARGELEASLPAFLKPRRWFAGKGEIKTARIRELIALPQISEKHFVAMVMVEYAQSEPEEYLLPLAFASGAEAERLEKEAPGFIFARVHIEQQNLDGIIYDAAAGKDFGRVLFEVIARRRTIRSEHTECSLMGSTESLLRGVAPEPSTGKTEERNTIVSYGDQFILKLFRHLETGKHPALEAAEFLAQKKFPHVPPFIGALELERGNGDRTCLGILSGLHSERRERMEIHARGFEALFRPSSHTAR